MPAPPVTVTGPSRLAAATPPHVLEFAFFLAARAELQTLVLVGSNGTPPPDAGWMVEALTRDGSQATAWSVEPPPSAGMHTASLAALPDELVRSAVVLCSDVLEHMADPAALLAQLATVAQRAPYLLLTTPDRDRDDRGRWSAAELHGLLREAGLDAAPLRGRTWATRERTTKSALLVLDGTHVRVSPATAPASVAAVLHVYNEADMLEETLRHLTDQGVQAHVFDNWSIDGSWDLITALRDSGVVANGRRFPDVPVPHYDLIGALAATSAYARTLAADWILVTDGDELRESPWPGVSLAQALGHVGALGFNAIDFTVIDFRFTAETCDGPREYARRLRHFEFGRRPGHFVQVKGWRNVEGVELSSSAGHNAMLPERRVFPLKFLLKHYPLRHPRQAARKVFRDRLPRYAPSARQRGWHVQYNSYEGQGAIGPWSPTDLELWEPQQFASEYFVERLSGIGVLD